MLCEQVSSAPNQEDYWSVSTQDIFGLSQQFHQPVKATGVLSAAVATGGSWPHREQHLIPVGVSIFCIYSLDTIVYHRAKLLFAHVI